MPKLKKQIQDSKLKRDFKKREKIRAAKQRSKKESELAKQKEKSKEFVKKNKAEKEISQGNFQKLQQILNKAPEELEEQVIDTLREKEIDSEDSSAISDSDVFEMPESELDDLEEEYEENQEGKEQEKETKKKSKQDQTQEKQKKKSKTIKLIDPTRLKELLKNARTGSTSALRKMLYLFKEIFLISANISPEMALEASTKTVENSIFRAFFLVIPELIQKQSQNNKDILGKVYSGYLIQIISQLSDLSLFLNNTDHIIPVIKQFPPYLRKVTQSLLQYWDQTQKQLKNSYIEQTGTALQKFAQLVNQPDYTQLIIKKMYLYLTAASKRAISNRGIIQVMKENIVKIVVLNSDVAYQSGFLFLRQLAIHIRKALQKPSTQLFQSQIFTLQIVECLDVWKLAILASLESDMHLLVYPFSQIVFCILRLSTDLRFVPAKLRLIEMLHEMSHRAKVYQPTAGVLLEILSSRPNWYVKDIKSEEAKAKHFSFEHAQLTKQHLKNPIVLLSILKRVRLLFLQFFELNQKSVAFPELLMPIEESIRKFMKHSCPTNAKGYFKRLLEVTTEHSALIKKKRGTSLKQALEMKQLELQEPTALTRELKKLKE